MKTLLVATLLLFSTLVLAQPGEEHPAGMPRGNRGPGMERMRDRKEQLKEMLHLTDDQEAQIRKLHFKLERAQADVQSKIRLARLDLREQVTSDKVDRSGMEQTMKQVSELQLKMKLNFLDFWFSVNNILKPEQQKLWKEHIGGMMAGARQRMHGQMGRHRMLPPPMHGEMDDN